MAEVGASVTLKLGGLANKDNPLRLGRVDQQTPDLLALVKADNVDIDDFGTGRMRQGRRKIYSGSPHSFHPDHMSKLDAYFVDDSELTLIDPSYDTTNIATLGANDPVSYTPVNDDTVLTNGTNIGWIKNRTYDEFNPTITDTYEVKMPAGQFVAFYKGVLYVAVNDVLYVSKPYKVEVYDKRHGIIPLGGPIRMLGQVEDGVWISTTKGVAFLAGGGTEDFVYKPRTKAAFYGAFYVGHDFKDNLVVAWASEDGILLGKAGGVIERATPKEVVFPEAAQGKVFKTERNGIDQWVAVIHNPGTLNAYADPAITVNSVTL